MLLKLIDAKGITHWVNPLHVKMLREKKGVTEVFITMNPSWPSPTLKIKEPIDTIAALINASMPDNLGFIPDDDLISGSHGTTTAV
ncbi:MAG: hypothetical protein KF866_02685 [Phycisphaeraceae bacterium]|nr:hypothetical protein [Phycisphaeraceae bacterium]MCW5753397.1 hypothetical protein [Phycisphaeraceae bacterium]